MANLREKVDVEMENVSAVIAELEKIKDKSNEIITPLRGLPSQVNGAGFKLLL